MTTPPPPDTALRTKAVSRLIALEDTNQLTHNRLQGVADAFGVHPRTVKNWINNARAHHGTYTPASRARFELSEHMLATLARWCGNTTSTWRDLKVNPHPDDPPLPSLPTFHRAVNRTLSPGQRAGLRAGEKARRAFDVAGKRERHHRNHAWETDHVEASVKVRIDGQLRKPWLTFLIDCAHSAICGLAITPQRPSREAVLVAIRDAILIDDHHGTFGGIPDYVRVDGGKEFLCRTVRQAFGALGTEIIELPPYTPDGKGNIEAVNGAIKKTLFAGLPGYTHAPGLIGGKPVTDDPPYLHFEAFVGLVLKWVHHWNHEHTLPGLDGQTPAQSWRADTTPIHTVSAGDLHTYTLERHGRPLTINHAGVRYKNRDYIADWMHGFVGEKVTLRYLPHHDHRIELYDPQSGHHLGSAFMANQATPEQVRALKRAQRREADRLRARLKKADQARRIRYAAVTQAEPPTPLIALPEDEALTYLRDLDEPAPDTEPVPDLIPLPAPADDWVRPQPNDTPTTPDGSEESPA